MERMNDDVKRQLLDKLSKEPPMVLATAYAYAQNYVLYGEDITKAWTTAVQQVSVIREVRNKAWMEAYDSFHKEYENSLKADVVAMLTELKTEIEELGQKHQQYFECQDAVGAIQQKINALEKNTDENNN